MGEQTIVLILAVHWLADFVGQSDWMAQNKSKRLWPLLAHVLVYTAILAILGWRWAVVTHSPSVVTVNDVRLVCVTG